MQLYTQSIISDRFALTCLGAGFYEDLKSRVEDLKSQFTLVTMALSVVTFELKGFFLEPAMNLYCSKILRTWHTASNNDISERINFLKTLLRLDTCRTMECLRSTIK